MKKNLDELGFFHYYHNDTRNLVAHMIGFPLLFFAIASMPYAVLTSYIAATNAWTLSIIYAALYFEWNEPLVLLVWCSLVAIMGLIADVLVTIPYALLTVSLPTLVFSLICLEVVGHRIYQGRKEPPGIFTVRVGFTVSPMYLTTVALSWLGAKGSMLQQAQEHSQQWEVDHLCRTKYKNSELFTLNGITLLKQAEWTNLSRSSSCKPQAVFLPQSVSQVQEVVRLAKLQGQRVRPCGAGYSWSPITETNGFLIDISLLRHIDVDDSKQQVTLELGATVEGANEVLASHKLCIPSNVLPLRAQYGGVLATGSHGLGWNHGSLCDLLISVSVVNSDSEVYTFSKHNCNSNEWRAIMLNLGALGIMVQATLQAAPMYSMAMTDSIITEEQCENVNFMKQSVLHNEMVEVLWFPSLCRHVLKTWTKQNNRGSNISQLRSLIRLTGLWLSTLIGNNMFAFYARHPKLAHQFGRLLIRPSSIIDTAPGVIHYNPFVEKMRTQNVEFAVRISKDLREWHQLHNEIASLVHNAVGFPVDICVVFSFGKCSNAMLSPAVGPPNEHVVYVSFLSTVNNPAFQDFVTRLLLNLSSNLQVKMHWAKMLPISEQLMKQMYGENLQCFKEIRNLMDPHDMFLNNFLAQMLCDTGKNDLPISVASPQQAF